MNFIKYLFLLAAIMVYVNANAGYFECNGLCYNTLSDSTVEVINAKRMNPNAAPNETYNDSIIKNGKVIIPSMVSYFGGNFTVVSIGDYAFHPMAKVKEYELPTTITSIGDGAFWENGLLEKINIPDGVTSIGSSAFEKDKALKTVYLPNGITSIGKSAFAESGITTINLPSSLTRIEKSTFYWCNGLKEITIPDKVEIIDERAFQSCSNLESVHIGAGLKEIKEFGIGNCDNLSCIEVSKDNPNFYSENNIIYTKDKTCLYFSAPNQTGNYVMPQTVTSIGLRALQGSKFNSIKFSDNLNEIGKYGLLYCPNLIALVLPSSIKHIPFMSTRCNNLKYLVLGKDFSYIYDSNEFGNLERIICYNTCLTLKKVDS